MALDESTIRRIMREERENERREAADKAERDDLRSRLEKLEAKREKPDHEAEPDDKGDDHPFEV